MDMSFRCSLHLTDYFQVWKEHTAPIITIGRVR